MGTPTATLIGVLTELRTLDASHPAVFQTREGDIGSGYHVTEFKLASVIGIDCGTRISQWRETLLQLLDGAQGEHMSVKKFAAIADKSIEKVPGLGEAPFFVEFAPGNRGLRRYRVSGISSEAGRVVLGLAEDRATCKPAAQFGAANTVNSCCGGGAARAVCCA